MSLFTMKPGLSLRTFTAVLPSFPQTSATWSSTAGSVLAPGITSTSFMTIGGLKKCIPTILSGLGTASARSVILMFEVLEAYIAPAGACSLASLNTDFLRLRDSGTASTTMSTPSTALAMSPK